MGIGIWVVGIGDVNASTLADVGGSIVIVSRRSSECLSAVSALQSSNPSFKGVSTASLVPSTNLVFSLMSIHGCWLLKKNSYLLLSALLCSIEGQTRYLKRTFRRLHSLPLLVHSLQIGNTSQLRCRTLQLAHLVIYPGF